MEGDYTSYHLLCVVRNFNPLPPHGGRLGNTYTLPHCRCISIHSLRMEGDQSVDRVKRSFRISIHSLRMEGDVCQCHSHRNRHISIHSLRMEGDLCGNYCRKIHTTFQSTPSAWRETIVIDDAQYLMAFQSTPSAWRETFLDCVPEHTEEFQSTPSAWRETQKDVNNYVFRFISIHSLRMEGDDGLPLCALTSIPISIHSLRMEGDNYEHGKLLPQLTFQSTPSAWRETCLCSCTYSFIVISIHSLRMEGDSIRIRFQNTVISFQSTPSAWRETDRPAVAFSLIRYFNPLPPHGGRLCLPTEQLDRCDISIHSLRMEGDLLHLPSTFRNQNHFNPLPPHGGRRLIWNYCATQKRISIHSLRMEGDITEF